MSNSRAYLRWKKKEVDGKEAFLLRYVDMGVGGSWEKVRRHYKNSGKVNSKTGKSFSTMAFYHSAWDWAINNIEEAKEIYTKFCLMYGENLIEDWADVVNQRAKRYLNKPERKEFFEKYPEYNVSDGE